jgi:hypothetical protein
MLAMTPPSPERDTNELELLIATSQMILATKGAATPEAVEINARAEELAEKTGNLRRLAEQIYGSYNASRVSGNHPSAMSLADQLLDLARRDGSALTMGLATHAQSVTRLFLGDLIGPRSISSRARPRSRTRVCGGTSSPPGRSRSLAGMPGSWGGLTRQERGFAEHTRLLGMTPTR